MTAGERLAAHGLALPAGHTLVAVAEDPAVRDHLGELAGAVWPEFMLNGVVPNRLWHHLGDDFPEFQMGLFDSRGDLAAGLNSAPLAWDGTNAGLPAGWDDQLERSVAGLAAGTRPDTLGALQVAVPPDRRGSGYSGVMTGAMRAIARASGFRALIACVRPSAKEREPLAPIDEYAARTREDGLPEDPWIRLHVRLGARIVRPSPASMRIEGTIAEWRDWTGLAFPASGAYLPEGAIAPVLVDLDADRGVYLDPNVWVVHDLA